MDKALIYGQALAQLRMRARLSQDKAAEAAGTSQPTWARYENGDSRAFYDRLAVRAKIVRALGFSLRDLDTEAEALMADTAYATTEEAGEGVSASGGVDLGALNRPTLRRVSIQTDELGAYLRMGGFAVYDTARLPKPGDGVIVHLRDGQLLPRFYLRQAADLWVEYVTADGEVRSSEALSMALVAGVYPIVLRGDAE